VGNIDLVGDVRWGEQFAGSASKWAKEVNINFVGDIL
jgi:hypothetical protein